MKTLALISLLLINTLSFSTPSVTDYKYEVRQAGSTYRVDFKFGVKYESKSEYEKICKLFSSDTVSFQISPCDEKKKASTITWKFDCPFATAQEAEKLARDSKNELINKISDRILERVKKGK